ncbi:MAG: hypothetical protein KIT22_01155 [Verrucomicrobiae bacterium]|nr:hypothetical protein [Verrucomicrobiae bacterium]
MSLGRQLREQYLLWMKYPAWLFLSEHHDWYYRKQLYDPDISPQASHSIPEVGKLAATTCALWTRNQIRRKQPRPSDRKSHQARQLQSASVPTIPLIAKVGCGQAEFQSGYDADHLPETGLFAKLNSGYQGRGAMAWTCAGPNRYLRIREATQREWTGREIVEQLRAQATEYVLQPRLVNHPDLVELTGETLCGVRILTFTDPATLLPVIFPYVWMKIARAGAIVDNLHAPGALPAIAASVEISSGVLGPALGADLTWQAHHPDRGSRIEGRVLPYWKETLEAAMAAHRAFRPHGWAWGWDIAPTAHGPIVLEGNSNPDFSEEFFRDLMFGDVKEVSSLIELCLLAERS